MNVTRSEISKMTDPIRLGAMPSRFAAFLGMGLVLATLAVLTAASCQAQNATATPALGPNPYLQMGQGVTGINNQTSAGAVGVAGQTSVSPGIQMLGAGQGNNSPMQTMAMLYPDPTQYVLSPGDLVGIRIFASPDYNPTERISKDGTVQLPLIGSVTLGGITIRQAEDLIATRLKTAGMYRNPEVTIAIAETSSPQTISFAGEKAGVYLVQGQRTLLDVISGSGGLPANAGRIVSIIRPGVEEPIVVNLGSTPQDLVKANIPVLPHDTIFIERAGAVYVLGAFKQQGAFPLQTGRMTMMQAAALAGGPLYAGKYSDMRLVRTIGNERQEVKVDIKRILFGLDPDPILQPGDILFLPTTPLKAALAAGGLSTLIGAISVLLIAIYQR